MNRIPVILMLIIAVFILQSNLSIRSIEKDKWKFHESEAFRIYYVNSYEPEARESAEFLETEFDRVTTLLGFIPVVKIEIYLIPEGRTKLKLPKSDEAGIVKMGDNSVKNELIIEFTRCLLKNMYSRKELKLMDPWFISGVSGYVAGIESDPGNIAQTTFEPVNLRELENLDAMITGNLIWNYLVKMNGEGAIAHILNSARILKSDRGAIEQFVGIPFEMVMNNCKKYYYN